MAKSHFSSLQSHPAVKSIDLQLCLQPKSQLNFRVRQEYLKRVVPYACNDLVRANLGPDALARLPVDKAILHHRNKSFEHLISLPGRVQGCRDIRRETRYNLRLEARTPV